MSKSQEFADHTVSLHMTKHDDDTFTVLITNIGDQTIECRLDGIALPDDAKKNHPYAPGQTRKFALPRLRRMIVEWQPMDLDQLVTAC